MFYRLVILISVLVLLGFRKSESVEIRFNLLFNNEQLALSSKPYVYGGDTLFVDACRFYLSNFSFRRNNKWIAKPDSYFLIDAEDPASQKIVFENISEADSVSFLIGVDSIANVSGALDGALDPAKGMYWAWNTGYINAKLEGHSNVCKTLHHAFEFHVGGYLAPFKTARKIQLKLNDGVTNVRTELTKWLNNVKLKELNSVVQPCKEAMMIADNYKHMFSVE